MTPCEACEKSDMEHKNSMPPVLEVREYHHALIALRTKRIVTLENQVEQLVHDLDEALAALRMLAFNSSPDTAGYAEARRILAEGKKP